MSKHVFIMTIAIIITDTILLCSGHVTHKLKKIRPVSVTLCVAGPGRTREEKKRSQEGDARIS